MQVQVRNKRFYFKIQDYTSGTTKKYPVIAMNLEEARNILYSTYFNGRTDDTYDILAIKEISKSYYSSIVRKGGFPVNRGVKAPLLEVDVRNAMANTNSNRAAAIALTKADSIHKDLVDWAVILAVFVWSKE